MTAIKPCLDQLLSHEFHVSSDLYDRILRDAGETQSS
ncbi:MAG: DUF3368 domain-containing protein [bacterium]|nr:DUF3368 domain-containing protein [bacterium]